MTETDRIEFGDFQTPPSLAQEICQRLKQLGIRPACVVEPTCGVGAFLMAAAHAYPDAERIIGFDIQESHLDAVRKQLSDDTVAFRDSRIALRLADFFQTNWEEVLAALPEPILVIGNFPWVTNSVQGTINGTNLPSKSNFLGFRGLDAITGKANFDISEWMLLEVINWFRSRTGGLAMLCKSSVARKVIAHAETRRAPLENAAVIKIDAKKHFGVSVDAALLVMQFRKAATKKHYDYTLFENLEAREGQRLGHRHGTSVSNLAAFEANVHFLGSSPQKWRSGIKHDVSAVMELRMTENGLLNGFGELVTIESSHLYPLMKGSDVGNPTRVWKDRFLIVPQTYVGERTDLLAKAAPKTWAYLNAHLNVFAKRKSRIYKNNPPFSIFGVGEYTFKPWKIAICSLYKNLNFRLVGPINGRPVVFDDTTYIVGFDTEEDASLAFRQLRSPDVTALLSSMIFRDQKRPVTSGILNKVDWSRSRVIRFAA